jgi:hypothetical protein
MKALTFNEFLEGRFARLRNEGFLKKNLVDQSVDISPTKTMDIHDSILTQGSD